MLGVALLVAIPSLALLGSAREESRTGWAGLGWSGLPERIALPHVELLALPGPRDLLRSHFFRLARVDVFGLQRVARSEIDARAGLSGEPPLIDIDPAEVCRRVAEHPRLSSCASFRLPPKRVVIRIVEREPLARIGESLRALDADGVAFPIAADEASELPRVRGNARGALPLLRAAHVADIAIAEVLVRSVSEVRFRPAHSRLWVITGRSPERALHMWRTVRASAALDEHRVAEVDLRFEGNVVLRGTPGPREEVEDGTS